MQVWIVEERHTRGGWRTCGWLNSDCFSSEQDAANALLTAAKTCLWANTYDSVGPDSRRTELGTCYCLYKSGPDADVRSISRWRIRSLELK
jgi:hypothetical protein